MACLTLFAFVAGITAQSIIAPSATFSLLPRATDDYFGGFASDGGAGGFVPQWNMTMFSISDGSQCNSRHFNNLTEPNDCTFPVHTGYAMIDYQDPSKLVVVGNYSGRGSQYQPGVGAFWQGTGGLVLWDSKVDPKSGITDPTRFGPAPHTSAINIPGNSTGMLNVWGVHNDKSAFDAQYVFTTMFEMNWIGDANALNYFYNQVPTQRIVPVLFNVTAVSTIMITSGSMLTAGRGSEASTYFYLWEGDSTGWKIARAPWATRRDTTTYSFWHASGSSSDKRTGWVKNAPLHRNADAWGNVYNFTNFKDNNANTEIGFWGQDIRWVDRFQTYIITFQPQPGYDLYVQHSLTGLITGPYSNPVNLAPTTLDPQCQKAGSDLPLTDFAQVHWDYYGVNSNKTLVSYISCTNFQSMGVLTWTNGYNNYPSPAKSYRGP
ncbi:hypothetical protein AMS68_003230 [Peltaster fructicola]|uniref:DUF4185 domain-containing protein n=1 Tax=Peltaster fructicola TaxID=286661 RepID=A0A6H0XSL4_9PEZI|nr:hypothetical protein AMS68_003230 [Peltaster fructicola]